jgi:nucleoside-diphosphate-sugar epimerase
VQKVLITGATGFIGRSLVRYFEKKQFDLRCLVRPQSETSSLANTELAVGSVSDFDSLASAVDGVDTVIHLAGMTKSLRPQQLWDVNENGTRNLAKACVEASSNPKLVLISSLAAAGPLVRKKADEPEDATTRIADESFKKYRLRREDDLPEPVSNYGRSKLAGEQAVLEVSDQIATNIVRPPIVFGPHDRDGFEMFGLVARFGVHLVPGWFQKLFSLVHVEDLCRGIDAVATQQEDHCQQNEPSQGVYFISDPKTVTYAELGRLIGQSVGRNSVRCIHVPRGLVYATGIGNEIISQLRRRPHIFGFDKSREATTRGFASTSTRLQNQCDFNFKTSLVERLNETADWYREHGWL